MANEVRDLVPEVTFVIGETFPEATAAYRERKVRETLRDLDPRHLPGPGEIREIASQSLPRIPARAPGGAPVARPPAGAGDRPLPRVRPPRPPRTLPSAAR